MERSPRKPRLHACAGARRPENRGDGGADAKPRPPLGTGAPGYEVPEARSLQEREAVALLGPRHVPHCALAPARGLGQPPGRALPTHHLPLPLLDGLAGLPGYATRRAAAGGRLVRARSALPQRPRGLRAIRLRAHGAGVWLALSPAMDGAGLPACPALANPTRQPLLRRLLRGEFGKPRPLR